MFSVSDSDTADTPGPISDVVTEIITAEPVVETTPSVISATESLG